MDISHSKACCSRPPVTLRGGYNYNQAGKYVEYNGLKTYETGSPTTKRGILMIYDIFGIFVQTVRGADILASGYHETPDQGGEYKVFMPDWFGDHAANVNAYPPKTPKDVADINAFMNGPADPTRTVPKIAPLMETIKKANPQIEDWAILGFCWGGKIAALVSQEGSLFKASGQCHPSLLERTDAAKVTIPMVVLPSLDEVPEEVDPWIQDLKTVSTSSFSETFADSVHGWMASRADFEDLHKFEEYLRGYRIVREFFAQFL
ncbi:putative AIM2 family protein [Lachnellula cervina]|uniref:Putative AIM2 family protein n=1 Tax=Lachnellula cervina TaxID=1316786 RepID=A0A7D8UMC3_9HELO|nr:putative AIM2 family protein [Lachnellula cervina]